MNKKVACYGSVRQTALLMLGICMLTVISAGQVTNTESTVTIHPCSSNNSVSEMIWSNWSYKDSSGVAHPFSGSTYYYKQSAYQGPGGQYEICPGANQPFDAYSNDEKFYIEASEGFGTVGAVGIINPKYQVQSIIYSAPGNRSSSGFTNTETDGSTTSVGKSFTSGATTSFGLSGGFLGTGSTISWSFGNSATTGNTTVVTDTIADATGVANASPGSGANAISHLQDLFIIWLNPAVKLTQEGVSNVVYSLGTQPQTTGDPDPGSPEIQDQVEVFAQVMSANASGATTVPVAILEPQTVDGQTLPGLANICANLKTSEYLAKTCTLGDQCGCVPSDFAPILAQDPILNYPSTESPLNADTSGATVCANPKTSSSCRYIPVPVATGSTTQETELLEGPNTAGGNIPVNTFSQTDSTETTQTLTETDSYTVGFSEEYSFSFLGTGLSFTNADQWTWTDTESAGEINGFANQMTVSFSSSTVGCDQEIPIFEDTVYHTFVFQQPSGNTSCP
jgi:hypothetical protein